MNEVMPGQVWADNDKRHQGRQLKVLSLFSDWRRVAEARRQGDYSSSAYVEALYARCEVVVEGCGQSFSTRGRQVTIRVDRFRPTSTGYRLVEEAPA